MSRIIQTSVRTSAVQASRCVGSLFALELLQPGSCLYVCAPLLRNTAILPNHLRQFGALIPDAEAIALTLSVTLSLLAERGTTVRLIYPIDEIASDELLTSLSPLVACRATRPLYHQGIFSERFSLRGGLLFTDYGVDIDGEQVELTVVPSEVSRALIEMAQYWEDLA